MGAWSVSYDIVIIHRDSEFECVVMHNVELISVHVQLGRSRSHEQIWPAGAARAPPVRSTQSSLCFMHTKIKYRNNGSKFRFQTYKFQ